MGEDSARVRARMEAMTANIAGKNQDMRHMNHSNAVMTNSMGHMGRDINKFSNPQRKLPFMP